MTNACPLVGARVPPAPSRGPECHEPPDAAPACPRPRVHTGIVRANASRLPSAPRPGSIRASGRIRCTRMHLLLPEARIFPVNDALVASGHDVPLETARSDHRFTVASMTRRQAGRMRAELAWPHLPGLVCHRPENRGRLAMRQADQAPMAGARGCRVRGVRTSKDEWGSVQAPGCPVRRRGVGSDGQQHPSLCL